MRIIILPLVIGICIAQDSWSDWSSCAIKSGSRDTNCIGTQSRTGESTDPSTGAVISLGTQNQNCFLTTKTIDGGYTSWTQWEDCSLICTGKTNKYRYCNKPTPCNGGKTCEELGIDLQTKSCGPINGQWGDWGPWGVCAMPTGSSGFYGTGNYVRYRNCDTPKPICQGDYCIGVNNETGNCRNVPPCLTFKMFDDKFLRVENPMIIYTSAQVAIYLLTKNKCAPFIVTTTYYELYMINTTSGIETQIGNRRWSVKYKFNPGTLKIGLYRLYSRISYFDGIEEHWMEESMYIRIVHPPPHAFIMGGSGKTIPQGDAYFDARSVSYSLTKGPGDPSGLTFKWICLNFVTKNIYNLLQFNINPVIAFQENTGYQKKWYETDFTGTIQNQVAFIEASDQFSNRIKYLRGLNTPCNTAKNIYVKVKPKSYKPSSTTLTYNVSTNGASTTATYTSTYNVGLNDTTTDSVNYEHVTTTDPVHNDNVTTANPVTSATTTQTAYDLLPLSFFYNITYLFEMFYKPVPLYSTKDVLAQPKNDTIIMNQIFEFLGDLYGPKFATFAKDTVEFFELLSQSSLTLESLLQLRELTGLPESANESFFSNLEVWLNISVLSKTSTSSLISLLDDFKYVQKYLQAGKDVINYAGIDGFLELSIDSKGRCLLDYIGEIIEGFSTINNYDWNNMKQQEKFYMNWLEQELFISSACKLFTGSSDGTGKLTVTNDDVNNGTGFLLFIRVEFEESVSYFIQHAQSVMGNPPQLELECRLNCMKKAALSSIMSLKATCKSCTYDHLLGSKVWWNVKDFDLSSRIAKDNPYWSDWMLSANETREFVMMANVLKPNTGYLIEATMELSNGGTSIGIWIITTNILPYNGTCEIEDSDEDKKVITAGWKDEGFRSTNDPSIDWKEQLNYRIVQMSTEGTETLLYYGAETENYIRVKPGTTFDNVTIKIQIFDIFIDFTECINNIGIIPPNYTVGNDASIATFLNSSGDNIEYFWKTGNIKQVAMNTEVAGTPLSGLTVPSTIFDTVPSEWINLGVQTLSNGSSVMRTFEELWEMYQNPDLGNTTTSAGIINKLSNFSNILSNASDVLDGTSTVNIVQMATSIGSILTNKDFVANNSASDAFKGNKVLVDKLARLTDNETYPKYEDYISTCEGLLRALSNALEAILPKSSIDTPSSLDVYTIMDDLSIRSKFNNLSEADLTLAERAFLASRIALKNELDAQLKNDIVKTLVPVLLESISNLGHVLQRMNYRKQMPVNVKKERITSAQDQQLISDLVRKGIETNGVGIKFDESNSRSTKEQNIQVTLFDHTPFSWDAESKYISSKTVTISVGEDNNTNTVIPSKIKLPTSDMITSVGTVYLAIPTENNESTSQMLLYKMYWKNPKDSLIVSLKNVIDYLKHVVYIRTKDIPTEDIHDWNKTITAVDFVTNDEIKVVVDGNLYTEASLVYIGVLVSSEANHNVTNTLGRRKRSTGLSTSTVVEYQIIGITTGCRVWDENTQTWDKTSCKLSRDSTVNETICECSNPPGNSFATTFYVPPNTIDFNSVFDKFDLINNAAVFATVVSLVLVYLIVCVWAYRQDRRDHDRWAISYLVDNSPHNEYLYMLTVYTGLHRHAGTKSNVMFMIINGKSSDNIGVTTSDVRYLDDESHKGFGFGSVRRFVMSVEKRIDDPSVLKIWHDNSGSGHDASWYLDKVVLEDIQTQDKYIFICNQWLSLDHDEGSIDCALPVSDKADQKKFLFLFNEKTRQNTTDSHLWLSVAIRPEESNFTRLERLACCLALLFLTMISNAMFFGKDTGNKISIGPISFSLTGIYISFISALIAAPPIFIVTFLFRNSRQRKPKQLKENDSNQKFDCKNETNKYPTPITDTEINVTSESDLPLPFWCRYIAWGIISLAVIVSGFFLILYSMEWGKSKSEDWLLCFFFSFFETMFVVDPLKILMVSVVLSWIFKSYKDNRSKYDMEKLLAEVKKRTPSPASYLGYSYKMPKVPFKPLTRHRITKMKKKRKAVLQVQGTFKELVLYLIFLSVLYLVSFSNRDTRWFYLSQHLEEQLIMTDVEAENITIRFNQVTSATDLYAWLTETLTPFMFPKFATNGMNLNAYQRLYTSDEVNLRLGPFRLRQLRTKEVSCTVNLLDDMHCFDEYSILDEDDIDYCVGWETGPCIRGQDVYNITSAAWRFVSSVDNWGLPYTGLHSTYGGGGYIMEFVVNYNISITVLNDLHQYVWIDRQTRAVFIEFTLYNVDDNVFVYVSLLCEFPETGGVITSTSIKPFRPYQHIGSVGVITFFCELIVFIGIIILAVQKVLYIYHHGCKIFKELWNVLDVVIIVLFLICTAMYIGRWIMINYAMDTFETNKNKFVNFSHIASWDELFNILLAFIIFLTTLRIMRILSYNPIMNQIGNVLRNVSRDLLGCFVMFLIVYTAFVMFGYLIFGRYLETYKNIFVSSTTLTNAVIGRNSINDLFSIEPIIGRFYYFLFVLLLLWVLMTMLSATLNNGITYVNTRRVKARPTYGISNLLLDFWKNSIGTLLFTDNASIKTNALKEKSANTEYITAKDFLKRLDDICQSNPEQNCVTPRIYTSN